MPVDLPVLTVADASAWAAWLTLEASAAKGVWLTLAKKGTKKPTSLTYAQALDEALCHGWIDGQSRSLDEATYAQRYTPRTAKSNWSQRNVQHVARLEKEGRMRDSGRAAVASAKADGRWKAAYAGPATAEMPADFFAALEKVPAAQTAWDELSRSNRFAMYMRLTSLKTAAGREKRIKAFVDMLEKGESLLPQKGSAAKAKTTKRARDEDIPHPAPPVQDAERRTKRGRRVPSYAE